MNTAPPASGNQSVLEARALTKVFRGVRALDEVSFALEPNCIHGLLGLTGRARRRSCASSPAIPVVHALGHR